MSAVRRAGGPRPGALWALLLFAAPSPAAATVTFSLGNTQVTPGVGEQIIDAYYPQYRGKGVGPDLEAQLNAAMVPNLASLTEQVNQRLGALHFAPFLQAMANAAGGVGNLLPQDRATEPSLMSISASLGPAFNHLGLVNVAEVQRDAVRGDAPNIGFGVGGALAVAFNLQALDLPRLGLFDPGRLQLEVSGMALNVGDIYGLAGTSWSYTNFGVHAQYRLVDGAAALPHGLLRWGGLAFGSGVHYGRTAMAFDGELPAGTQAQDFDWRGEQGSLQASWAGQARIALDLHTVSVPLEVWTSAQLLYLFTVYVGGGLDLNFGAGALSLGGREPAQVALVPAGGSAIAVASPVATLRVDDAAGPTVGALRGTAGVQLNLGVLALFVQASADTAHNLAAVLGARAFY